MLLNNNLINIVRFCLRILKAITLSEQQERSLYLPIDVNTLIKNCGTIKLTLLQQTPFGQRFVMVATEQRGSAAKDSTVNFS